MATTRTHLCRARAFALVELLVVIGILLILIGLLLPTMATARRAAVSASCLNNERQIGAAIFSYANDFGGAIPYGPTAPPPTATNFYPGTGDVTSLLSLESGHSVALGLLLPDYLGQQSHVLFCPGADQIEDADAELAKIGLTQAQGDYYFRHGSSVSLSDAVTPPSSDHIRLAKLGLNRNGAPIRALVMDQDFLALPDWSEFNIYTRTNHFEKSVNVLFSDGHAVTLDNSNATYTIDPKPFPENSFNLILKAFESADTTP